MPRGSTNTDVASSEITNAFLSERDGKEAGIWIIGATNRPELVDDGILARFGMKMEISLLDSKARLAILTQELKAAAYAGPVPVDASTLTQGMSARDLFMLAQRFAAKRNREADFPALVRQYRSA